MKSMCFHGLKLFQTISTVMSCFEIIPPDFSLQGGKSFPAQGCIPLISFFLIILLSPLIHLNPIFFRTQLESHFLMSFQTHRSLVFSVESYSRFYSLIYN